MLHPIELKESEFNIQSKKLINNERSLKKYNLLFVYANWCGHCTRFKKVYKECAKIVGNVFNFYQIDTDKCKDLTNSLKVKGYPSVYLMDASGRVYKEFNADRSSSETFLAELCSLTMGCPKIKK